MVGGIRLNRPGAWHWFISFIGNRTKLSKFSGAGPNEGRFTILHYIEINLEIQMIQTAGCDSKINPVLPILNLKLSKGSF